MAKKSKVKAGKKKAAPRQAARARSQAPAQQAKAIAYPCPAHVKKGAEVIPVQLSNAAHHERLRQEFGADNVEVLPVSRKVFVTVQRGMTDNTPVCVFPWEADILRLVHGGAVEEVSIEQMCQLKGAVKVERQKQKHSSVPPPDLRAQLEGMVYVDPEFDPANDPAAEYDRLVTVYGMDKEFPVPCVERVYGRFEAGGFEAKVKQFAKERGPKPAHLEDGGDGEPMANLSREELREACRERGIAFKATDGRDELVRKLGYKQAA